MKLLAGLLVLSKAQGIPGGPGAIAIQVRTESLVQQTLFWSDLPKN